MTKVEEKEEDQTIVVQLEFYFLDLASATLIIFFPPVAFLPLKDISTPSAWMALFRFLTSWR